MKFACTDREAELRRLYKERDALEQWHDFFAIWPREVANADCRWLETIQRRAHYVPRLGWYWEYRAKDSFQ